MPARILLIDDTPEIAELLSFALRDRGYDVIVEGYSGGVNEIVARDRIDAVVLDCSSLDMSESLFDTLRHEPAHAELPTVIISDTPEQAVAGLKARRARRVLLVPKPFTGSDVATALQELLHPDDQAEPGDAADAK